MSEHTELPWHYTNQLIFQQDGICIAETFSRGFETPNPAANAEYIVRACNGYKDLLAACKGLSEELEGIEEDEGITACQCLGRTPDDITEPLPCNYCKAKAAIAEASCTPKPR